MSVLVRDTVCNKKYSDIRLEENVECICCEDYYDTCPCFHDPDEFCEDDE